MASEKGYRIARDELGLTAQDRKVAAGMRDGKTQSAISRELGISRQRVSEIVRRLRETRGVDLAKREVHHD